MERLSVEWLRGRGWTVSGAARAVGRSREYVSRVLGGKLESGRLEEALRALPSVKETGRERAMREWYRVVGEVERYVEGSAGELGLREREVVAGRLRELAGEVLGVKKGRR